MVREAQDIVLGLTDEDAEDIILGLVLLHSPARRPRWDQGSYFFVNLLLLHRADQRACSMYPSPCVIFRQWCPAHGPTRRSLGSGHPDVRSS